MVQSPQFVLGPDWQKCAEYLPNMWHKSTWHSAPISLPSQTYLTNPVSFWNQLKQFASFFKAGLRITILLRWNRTYTGSCYNNPKVRCRPGHLLPIIPRNPDHLHGKPLLSTTCQPQRPFKKVPDRQHPERCHHSKDKHRISLSIIHKFLLTFQSLVIWTLSPANYTSSPSTNREKPDIAKSKFTTIRSIAFEH